MNLKAEYREALRRAHAANPNAPAMTLPATGNRGCAGGHGSDYVSFECGNLDEVEAHVRAFVAFWPEVVATVDETHSTDRYRLVRFSAVEDAPGLPGGPTQRELVRLGTQLARRAVDRCFEVSFRTEPVVAPDGTWTSRSTLLHERGRTP